MSLLDAKSCLEIFLQFLEPSRYFSNIKNDFSLFLKMIFNFKNRIIMKNKRSSNSSNIYMAGILSSISFHNSKPHPQIRSETPKIVRRSLKVVPTRRQLRRAFTFDPCIFGGIRGYRYVCLVESFVSVPSICRSDQRFIPNRRFCARLRRGSSSPVSLHHCCT